MARNTDIVEGGIIIDALFFVIVNRGKADAVMARAKQLGAKSGTILLGEGTAPSKILDLLGFSEVHKEVIILSVSEDFCGRFHDVLSQDFSFSKRNRGVAFSIPFKRWTRESNEDEVKADVANLSDYGLVVTVVDKGKGKAVVSAARAAGAKGGTIVRGRGAGTPVDYYFPLMIEPQKDTVLVLTPTSNLNDIKKRIFTDLNLGEVGKGVLFTLPVSRETGLYEDRMGGKA